MKKEITIKVNDLKTLIDGLNNAYIALNDIRTGLFLFGGKLPLDINEKWRFLESSSEHPTEKIDSKLIAIKNLYDQLINIEKEGYNNG